MLSIIADAISRLDELRNDRRLWTTCRYRETTNVERGSHDGNELERYRFLIALQYHYSSTDEELIRFLFDQEVIALQRDDFQGCANAIRLASYLLSRFKRGDDLWRFTAAKLANFDTGCGYDTQFLLSAGLDSALGAFTKGDPTLKEQIRDYLFDESGECWYTEEELSEWETDLQQWFPATIGSEPTRVWIERAIEFQCLEEGLRLFEEWEKEQCDEPLASLKYLRHALGDVKGAVTYQRRILEAASSPWDKISAAQSLADLLLEDKQAREAWQVVESYAHELYLIDGWHEVGLGRSLVKTAFDIANAPINVASHASFKWACERADELARTTLEILKTALGAAERLGDRERAESFRRAVDEEQARIDHMLKE